MSENIKELMIRKKKQALEYLENAYKAKDIAVAKADIEINKRMAEADTYQNLSELDWDYYAKMQLGNKE